MANGNGDAAGFLMGSLNGPSNTPLYFLIGAGGIMVAALATSKKARKVAQTEIGLGSQNAGVRCSARRAWRDGWLDGHSRSLHGCAG